MFVVAKSDFCQQSSHRWSTFESEWRPVFKVKRKSWKFSHGKSTSALRVKYFPCSLKEHYVPKSPKFGAKEVEALTIATQKGSLTIDWLISACYILLVLGGRKLLATSVVAWTALPAIMARVQQNSTASVAKSTGETHRLNDLVNIANQNDKSSWRYEVRHTHITVHKHTYKAPTL